MPGKKIKKDYSVMSTTVRSLLLTAKEKEIISEVEKKHNFMDGSLLNAIYYLENFLLELVVIKNQHPTSSGKNDVLEEIIIRTNKFLELFNNRLLKKVYLSLLNELTKFYQSIDASFMFELEIKLNFLQLHLDYPIPDSKIRNTYAALLKTTSELLACIQHAGIVIKTELDKLNLPVKNPRKTFMYSLKSDLENLIIRCNRIKFVVKEGRSYDVITKNCLLKLMSIYEEKTGNKVSLYISDYYDDGNIYRGKFCKFITDIFPILQVLLPEHFTISNITATAYEVLPHYRKISSANSKQKCDSLKMLYIHVLGKLE